MLQLFSFFILLFCLNSTQAALIESEKPNQINVYLSQNPPFSTFNAKSNAQGILVSYWQKWSNLTGITVKFYPFNNQNTELLSNNEYPSLYSGVEVNSQILAKLKKYPLLTINTHFYYLPTRKALSFSDENKSFAVGGLLANAEKLPIFSARNDRFYQGYPGLLELLIDVYNEQVDALVLFEGERSKDDFLNKTLSMLLDETLLKSTDNTLFIYTTNDQKSIFEWVNWGSQFNETSQKIDLAINKMNAPIWGVSLDMLIKILAISGFVFLLYLFNRSKRKKDRQFKSLLDDSPYPLVILSLNGNFLYYFNNEVELLFPVKMKRNKYIFESAENQILLSNFIDKVSHKTRIETERIRLFVDNSYHDIEISGKRVYYKRKTAWLCYLKDINALVQAEQKLTEERELLRKVLDSIPEKILFKSTKGSIIGCNEAWALGNNTTVAQATGKRLSDVVPINIVNKQKQQEEMVWSGEKFNTQEWVKQNNNDLSLINTVKVPLYNEKGGIFSLLSIERDVTDLYNLNEKLVDVNLQHKKTEMALSKQNILLSTVFAASVDPIGLLDKDGRVIGANNAFAILMGANISEDIIGHLQSDVLSQERNDWAEYQNQQVIDSGEPLIFEELIFSEGKKVWYEVSKTPFKDDESGYQGVVIVARNITLHKQTAEKLSSDASDFEIKMLNDPLTEIANRRSFDLQFEKLWREAADEEELLSLIMCDIDFFKSYNDNYGHQKGDEVLRKVAKTLESACEKTGSFVARYGGEEFVVLIKGGNATKALKIAEILNKSIEQINIEHLYSSASLIVSMSMGISNMQPSKLNSMDILLAEADGAMYEAKKNGRAQICVH